MLGTVVLVISVSPPVCQVMTFKISVIMNISMV